MKPPTLAADGVSVVMHGKRLLADVSLTFPPGSLTALLGPNGAGKTTLLRTLAGIRRPSSGRVLLGDTPLERIGRSGVARLCAYLPQETSAAFRLRVQDTVLMGRYPHRGLLGAFTADDYERVAWAMERVGVAHLHRRTLPTLSGGERQRVFLARALAQEAPILLLDEPAASLDVGRHLELLDLLAELNREGRTIVAALHDLRPALECFDRAILLADGRVAAEGQAETLVCGVAAERVLGIRVERGEGWIYRRVRPGG